MDIHRPFRERKLEHGAVQEQKSLAIPGTTCTEIEIKKDLKLSLTFKKCIEFKSYSNTLILRIVRLVVLLMMTLITNLSPK